MENEELKRQAIAILDFVSAKDAVIGKAWTGDASSIESVDSKSIRIMKLEVEYRKREIRKERRPVSKPRDAKPDPGTIDEWCYCPEWLALDGWGDESEWKEVCAYWERCTDCSGTGRHECSSCSGTGRRTCPECGGDGKVEVSV
jgi:hypothetical protein